MRTKNWREKIAAADLSSGEWEKHMIVEGTAAAANKRASCRMGVVPLPPHISTTLAKADGVKASV